MPKLGVILTATRGDEAKARAYDDSAEAQRAFKSLVVRGEWERVTLASIYQRWERPA